MKPMVIPLFGQQPLLKGIAGEGKAEIGEVLLRDFPDGETYLKFEQSVKGRSLIILTSLDRPNSKILALLFLAQTARELGAKQVGLIAPYLAYMRQDKRFHPGEGITSEYFAALISKHFDWLVTVDPHLHRHHQLGEIYSIPSRVIHAADAISKWVAREVERPLFIGPDRESEQWVSEVATAAGAPYIVLDKIRHGDQVVEVSRPEVEAFKDHTAVLVDDIISTAHTMIETLKRLKTAGMKPAVCIGVHAVFAGDAYERLLAAGAGRVITCNSIYHPSNQIDLSHALIEGLSQLESSGR